MEYDFSKTLCNAFAQPDNSDITVKFPELTHPCFFVRINNLPMIKLLRYIVAVYDINGLRVVIPDVVKRRNKAVEIAGFKRGDSGEYHNVVIDMMAGKIAEANDMIVQYLKLHKSPQYSYIMALDAGFYTLISKTLSGASITPGEVKSMRDMKDDIIEATTDFLNGDDNKRLLENTYKFLAEDSLGITPEDIAFRRQQGKKLVDVTPYGSDYNFDEYDVDGKA